MHTDFRRDSQPTSYTISNPACTGTSASCQCAGGYLCLTIADCHWKCLMTTLPPMQSSMPTLPASNSASGPSITAVPTTSVPGGATTLPSSSPENSGPSVTNPASSAPMEGTSGSPSSGGHGGTSQGGGNQSSAGQGGSTRTGGQQTGTAAPEQTTITVTHYPSTCRRQTGTSTLFITTSTSSCPATCPSR